MSKPAAESPGTESHPTLAGRHILVVDADESVWKSAHVVLAPLGCLVDWAESGERAAQWIKNRRLGQRYDAILAALDLPDMTGIDLYLSCQEHLDLVPFTLICSFGFDPGPRLAQARHIGIQTPLFKPLRRDQLLQTLEQSIGAAP